MTHFRTTAATEAVKQYAAERAIDDPAKLDRAARIVRAALARDMLSLDELVPSDRQSDGGGPVAA